MGCGSKDPCRRLYYPITPPHAATNMRPDVGRYTGTGGTLEVREEAGTRIATFTYVSQSAQGVVESGVLQAAAGAQFRGCHPAHTPSDGFSCTLWWNSTDGGEGVFQPVVFGVPQAPQNVTFHKQ